MRLFGCWDWLPSQTETARRKWPYEVSILESGHLGSRHYHDHLQQHLDIFYWGSSLSLIGSSVSLSSPNLSSLHFSMMLGFRFRIYQNLRIAAGCQKIWSFQIYDIFKPSHNMENGKLSQSITITFCVPMTLNLKNLKSIFCYLMVFPRI